MEAVLEPEGVGVGVGDGGGDRPAVIQVMPCISLVGNKEETKKMLTPKRNLSRVIKAVMFETLLVSLLWNPISQYREMASNKSFGSFFDEHQYHLFLFTE